MRLILEQTRSNRSNMLAASHNPFESNVDRESPVKRLVKPADAGESSHELPVTSVQCTTISCPTDLNGEQYAPPASISLQTVQYYGPGCRRGCPCRCHMIVEKCTSSYLQPFIGRPFLGYSGGIGFQGTCNTSDCRKGSGNFFHLTYHFSSWFLRRAFVAMFKTTVSPEAIIPVPRVISNHSPIWGHIILGDTEEIKEMFALGQASPFDVSEYKGLALLEVRSNPIVDPQILNAVEGRLSESS